MKLKELMRVLIAGDSDYEVQVTHGANRLVDQLWSTENLEIVDDGGRFSRVERVRRIAAPEHAIPCCGPLEKQLLPGAEHIELAVRQVLENKMCDAMPSNGAGLALSPCTHGLVNVAAGAAE